MTSVYPGEEKIEFSVKVGDTTFTSGTKSQTAGSVSGTFTVTYTQTATFTHSEHQGEVQCEVTWMGGTNVEKTVASFGVIPLDVYCKDIFFYI